MNLKIIIETPPLIHHSFARHCPIFLVLVPWFNKLVYRLFASMSLLSIRLYRLRNSIALSASASAVYIQETVRLTSVTKAFLSRLPDVFVLILWSVSFRLDYSKLFVNLECSSLASALTLHWRWWEWSLTFILTYRTTCGSESLRTFSLVY